MQFPNVAVGSEASAEYRVARFLSNEMTNPNEGGRPDEKHRASIAD
jgi:hypothetical protein